MAQKAKKLPANAGDLGSIPGSERSPGEGSGFPLVFLPREFHGQRSLVGHDPWGCKELDMPKRLTLSLSFGIAQYYSKCGP